MEIDHSTISQLMRGKRRFTAPTIRKLGSRLGLEQSVIARHIEQAKRRPRERDPASVEIQRLTQDLAEIVADGHHFAILELLRLKGFRPDSRWIARVLGISVDEVNVALQCLLRLGLLEMRSLEHWVDHVGHAMASRRGFTEVAIERCIAHLRNQLLRWVRSGPAAACELSMTTLAIDSKYVPEILQRIVDFRQELTTLSAKAPLCDEVYQLHMVFVPVTLNQYGE